MSEPNFIKSLWEAKCKKVRDDFDEAEKICDRVAINGILFFAGTIVFVVQKILEHKGKPRP